MSKFLSFLWRTPFALFSAFGFLSLSTGGGVMQVDSNVEAWIEIWTSITRPVWDFLLWPVTHWFDVTVPWYVKDYLTMGIIVSGMAFRFFYIVQIDTIQEYQIDEDISHSASDYFMRFISHIIIVLIWPIFISIILLLTIKVTMLDREEIEDLPIGYNTKQLVVFWETFVWFLLLIAFNYALLFKDGELRF